MRRRNVIAVVASLAVFATALWLITEGLSTPGSREGSAWTEGCESCPVPPGPLPRSNRLLGIDVTAAANGTYDDAFDVARDAGMQFTSLSLCWDELEPEAGRYEDRLLDEANEFYTGTKLALTVAVIDAVGLRTPTDLDARALDDPEVVSRFKLLLEHVFERLSDGDVFVLSIGSEVDACLDGDELLWRQYTELFRQTAEHARTLRPAMDVGVEMRYRALVQDSVERAQTLNGHGDVLLVSYYPLNDDFTVRPPWEVDEDLGKLRALYPDQTVMLLECGYPSGTMVGSSQELQADFVRQVFAAWDHRALWLRAVCFSRLHDGSPDALESSSLYYGAYADRYAEFIGTLGLRTSDGHPKAAFEALQTQADIRGW